MRNTLRSNNKTGVDVDGRRVPRTKTARLPDVQDEVRLNGGEQHQQRQTRPVFSSLECNFAACPVGRHERAHVGNGWLTIF